MAGTAAGRGTAGRTARAGTTPADWYEEADWPVRRRYRRPARLDPDAAADDLEARLDALRDEVRRVEADLMNLRGGESAARERGAPGCSVAARKIAGRYRCCP